MINSINSIVGIQKTSQNSAKEFNSTLPITIKVLSKSGPLRYLLQLGNIELSTKSLKELEIGSNYWGELNKNGKESIKLSKLIKKPTILQKPFPISLEYDDITSLIKDSSSIKEFKQIVVDTLSNVINKNDFVFLTNILLGFHEGVVTIPYIYNNINNILQYRYKKSKQHNNKTVQKIEFYTTFNNLGEIKGEIILNDNISKLSIYTSYQKVVDLLQKSTNNINGFSKIDILLVDTITPLYVFKERLLEIVA
jgi:hypothetical protein